MNKSICRVCKKSSNIIFSTIVLKKYEVKFYQCLNCEYVQTEKPFWLKEAYNVPISNSDTGIILRNLWLKNITTTLIHFFFNKNGRFLDYGGGYGIFVRLMRDIGFDFFWQDKHTENLFAKGFEIQETKNISIELLTCFEAFEHFVDPVSEIEKLLALSRNILISTEFVPDPVPLPKEWWYYGLGNGQHIGFFRKKTFDFIASKHKLNFFTNGQSIHLLTEKNNFGIHFFKWITKISKFTSPIIQKNMKSLTWKDMEKLKDLTL